MIEKYFFNPPVLLLALLSGLVLLGCDGEVNQEESLFERGQPVAFQSISNTFVTIEQDQVGNSDLVERDNLVIQSEEALETVWGRLFENLSPKPQRPDINFDQETVLIIILGLRTTGGYAVEVEQIVKLGESIGVRVKERIPGGDCATTSVLTSPYHVVKMPLTEGSFVFEDVSEVFNCNEQ